MIYDKKKSENIMKTFFISIITLLFFSAELKAEVVTGTFHPEKSQKAGQIFIENFLNWSP